MEDCLEILIVDDELLARKRIEKILATADFPLNMHFASSGKEAIAQLSNRDFDIVFLDIQMTDMTGFDVLKKTDHQAHPLIIFVTAFDHFAVRAFEVQALDFLMKPYKKERLLEALNRAVSQLRGEHRAAFRAKLSGLLGYLEHASGLQEPEYLEKVVLKLKNRYYFVEVSDIKYITSSAYYAEIFTRDNAKHVYRISMTDFIEKLPPGKFARVNRSTIVNMEDIKEIVSEGAGDFCVVMKDQKSFGVTRIYKKEFLRKVRIK